MKPKVYLDTSVISVKFDAYNPERKSLTEEFFAQALLRYGAVPANSVEDAYHIAIAVSSGMDYLLSWNFRHIVRLKTRNVVRMVTTLLGYKPIEILPPAELI